MAEQPIEFVTDFDDVMRENLGRVIATQDALGRSTYDDWAGFWPTSENEPFASFINGVQKFVVTSTRPGQQWENAAVIDGSLADFVRPLKQQPAATSGSTGASH